MTLSYTEVFALYPKVNEETLQILGRGDLTIFSVDIYTKGLQGGKYLEGNRDELEAAVVHKGDIVAWPKVMAMGMERGEPTKGHSAGLCQSRDWRCRLITQEFPTRKSAFFTCLHRHKCNMCYLMEPDT